MLEPVQADRATIWAVGDAADGGRAAARVADLIVADDPDRFLYLGDVYETGTAQEFAANYAADFSPLDAIAAPTPGNHEWPNRAQGYFPYWERAKGRPIRDYYAFRVGRWQILSLNSETAHDPASQQLRWLDRRLRRSRRFGDCRIAFWHRPLESAATVHGDQPDVEPLWDAIAGRARVVVNGHDHTMQRLRRRDGVVELIAGSGGRELYRLDPLDPRPRFANDTDHGALRIALKRESARLAFVTEEGAVVDSSRVRCHRG